MPKYPPIDMRNIIDRDGPRSSRFVVADNHRLFYTGLVDVDDKYLYYSNTNGRMYALHRVDGVTQIEAADWSIKVTRRFKVVSYIGNDGILYQPTTILEIAVASDVFRRFGYV